MGSSVVVATAALSVVACAEKPIVGLNDSNIVKGGSELESSTNPETFNDDEEKVTDPYISQALVDYQKSIGIVAKDGLAGTGGTDEIPEGKEPTETLGFTGARENIKDAEDLNKYYGNAAKNSETNPYDYRFDQVKKKLNIKKVGHAGTLDPLASGVVVVLINNGTKLSDFLLSEDKHYEFTIKLFTSTSTYDAEGEITKQVEPFQITFDQLREVVAKYQQYTYDQTPPIYSAIKVKGKKLYQYALDNQKIDIKPRTITINSLELLNYEVRNNELTFKANCSKGTYIRSLAS
ncbi:hypothetical protein FQA39_LY12884 [Lamprigera yunnana]|nr:hypothetical protein FQA39_LY12884 [Lamprigera yunnana]